MGRVCRNTPYRKGTAGSLMGAMQIPQWVARFNKYVTNPIQKLWAGYSADDGNPRARRTHSPGRPTAHR